jgi:CHAT domain-containing protein
MKALLPALLLALAGCAVPPASNFVGGARGGGEPVGNNAAGEACTRLPAGEGGWEVFCGSWQQPSARLRPAGTTRDLATLASAGTWREGIDSRFACAPPRPTTVLGDSPALLLDCTRRNGGWPHVAMVANVGGTAWQMDGVLPALPAMERALGVATGRARPEGTRSGAEALLADRLAARAFSAGDLESFETLIAAGNRANQAENAAAAEAAYAAALALQERALGANDPALAPTLAMLALQLSNQGRYPAAEQALARATALGARPGADPLLAGLLPHYRGMHLLNRARYAPALAELDRAAAGYAALLPPELLAARPAAAMAGEPVAFEVLGSPLTRSALLGLVETRRYRGVALQGLGRTAEAEAALASALQLARANRVASPVVNARLARSVGMLEASRGAAAPAAASLGVAAGDFSLGVPNTRPVARTQLLRAAQLAGLGRRDESLAACRAALAVLAELRSGVEPALIEPCLQGFASAAAADPANAQPVLAEMFNAAQLAQGGVTSRQIDQAAVRLAGSARDPRAGDAIRRYQDAQLALAEALRGRDELLAERRVAGTEAAESRLAAARRALAEADAELQAAAPAYGQLVQQPVAARDVLAALRPEEAFASVVLTGPGGWTFVLREGRIAAAPVEGGEPRIRALVRRVRAGIERTGPGLPRYDTAAAAELYAVTLGRLDNALQGATALAVAPSGPLLALPFEVLLTGPADPARLAEAPFLVRRMAVAHVPAPGNFVALRRLQPSAASQPWFGFGDFRPASRAQAARTFPGQGCTESAALLASLPPLPAAVRELGAARQLLGGGQELIGGAFTAQAVQRAPLRDARVLHFATHALLPAEIACQPEAAILASTPAAAPDASASLLTASAVANLELDADLVILSACNSGGPGGSTAGESLSGLARAFFYAGARSLMVTHWSVDDRMAAYLVAQTLAGTRQGNGISAALRGAQLAVLQDAGRGLPPEAAHPFFWATFALIGEGGSMRQASLASAARL